MKIRCDKCHVEFLGMLSEEEKDIEKQGTIIRTYMECPNCGTKYDICYNNSVSLSLMKAMNRDKNLLRNAQTEREYCKIRKRLKRRQQKLVEEWEKAKKAYYRKKETENNG